MKAFVAEVLEESGDFTPHCPCCGCIDIDYLIFLDDDGFTLRCDECGHTFTEDEMEEGR